MPNVLDMRLQAAVERGEGFHVLSVFAPDTVAAVAAEAECADWHVKAVWTGEASITYILFRYEAP